MIKEELMGERERRYSASVYEQNGVCIRWQVAKLGPERRNSAELHQLNVLNYALYVLWVPIKGMITQAGGHSLKYTADNNGGVTVYTPTAVSPPIYG